MKSEKTIVEQRIRDIANKLIHGSSREDIILYCSDNWKIGERQTDKYIVRAKALIEESVKRKVGYDYAKAVRRYEHLYKLNMDKKDYRSAMAVNKELASLQGLYKQQIEHAGEIKFISNIPD